MLSPGLHVEPLVDQRTEPSPRLSPLQPDQPCSSLGPAISHIDCFLVSFSEGPITIIVSHPLGKLQRTNAEQQLLTPSHETSLVFVALYLLLFSNTKKKQTM